MLMSLYIFHIVTRMRGFSLANSCTLDGVKYRRELANTNRDGCHLKQPALEAPGSAY